MILCDMSSKIILIDHYLHTKNQHQNQTISYGIKWHTLLFITVSIHAITIAFYVRFDSLFDLFQNVQKTRKREERYVCLK